jgi:hypothetical protein
MGTDFLLALKGLLGVMIPVLALSLGGLFVLSRSRLGEALARRIAGESRHLDCEAQLDGLHEEIAVLNARLTETQDRVDFAERLLAQVGAHPREIR